MAGFYPLEAPQAFDHDVLTGSGLLVVTAAKANKAVRVFITCETNNVRYLYDGGVPDATHGHILLTTAFMGIYIEGKQNVINLQFFPVTGTATVTVTYESS